MALFDSSKKLEAAEIALADANSRLTAALAEVAALKTSVTNITAERDAANKSVTDLNAAVETMRTEFKATSDLLAAEKAAHDATKASVESIASHKAAAIVGNGGSAPVEAKPQGADVDMAALESEINSCKDPVKLGLLVQKRREILQKKQSK